MLLGCHGVYGQAGLRLRWIVRLHKILHTLKGAANCSAFCLVKIFTLSGRYSLALKPEIFTASFQRLDSASANFLKATGSDGSAVKSMLFHFSST